jgi:hypothetical protein
LIAYLSYFVELLTGKQDGTLETLATLVSEMPQDPTVVYPWSVKLDDLAPEEDECDIPCSFSGPLYYLSKPHEEVVRDYESLFETHISEEWRKDPEVMAILNSEEAKKRFRTS